MLYTKSEFCKMAGVSKETLRHYLDKELIKPTMVSENGYRQFSTEDILDLWEIRLGVSFGNSLSNLKEKSEFSTVESFSEEISSRKADLISQLEDIKHQIARLEEIEYNTQRLITSKGEVTIEASKPVYKCEYDGSELSRKNIDLFINTLPYTSIAIDYSISNGNLDLNAEPKLALYVVESQKSKVDIYNFEGLEYKPVMTSLCMTIITQTPLSLKNEDFEPLFSEMKKSGLTPKSDIICSVFCKQSKNGIKKYMLKCRILV